MFLSSDYHHAMSYDSLKVCASHIIDWFHLISHCSHLSSCMIVLTLMNNWMNNIILINGNHHLWWFSTKSLPKKSNEKFSLALYLIMGWLVIFIIPQIVSQTNPIFGSHAHRRSVLHGWSWKKAHARKNHTSTWFGTSSSLQLLLFSI